MTSDRGKHDLLGLVGDVVHHVEPLRMDVYAGKARDRVASTAWPFKMQIVAIMTPQTAVARISMIWLFWMASQYDGRRRSNAG